MILLAVINVADIAVVMIILALLFFALRALKRSKKSGGCAGCIHQKECQKFEINTRKGSSECQTFLTSDPTAGTCTNIKSGKYHTILTSDLTVTGYKQRGISGYRSTLTHYPAPAPDTCPHEALFSARRHGSVEGSTVCTRTHREPSKQLQS